MKKQNGFMWLSIGTSGNSSKHGNKSPDVIRFLDLSKFKVLKIGYTSQSWLGNNASMIYTITIFDIHNTDIKPLFPVSDIACSHLHHVSTMVH
jgi:hypothetical protein